MLFLFTELLCAIGLVAEIVITFLDDAGRLTSRSHLSFTQLVLLCLPFVTTGVLAVYARGRKRWGVGLCIAATLFLMTGPTIHFDNWTNGDALLLGRGAAALCHLFLLAILGLVFGFLRIASVWRDFRPAARSRTLKRVGLCILGLLVLIACWSWWPENAPVGLPPTFTLEGLNDERAAVAISSDGKFFAAVSMYQNNSKAWFATTAPGRFLVADLSRESVLLSQEFERAGEDWVGANAVSFQPNGHLLAISTQSSSWVDRGEVRVWDIELKREVKRIEKSMYGVFSPDGRFLVVEGLAELQFLSTDDWTVKRSIPSDFLTVQPAFSRGGQYLATLEKEYDKENERICLYDVQQGRRIGELIREDGQDVASFAWSADGAYLAVLPKFRDVEIWDWKEKRKVRTVESGQKNEQTYSIGYGANPEQVAIAQSAVRKRYTPSFQILVFEGDRRSTLVPLNEDSTGEVSIAISQDGKTVVACPEIGPIQIWRLDRGDL